MLACRVGHLEVARLLCEAGADKDKANEYDTTAILARRIVASAKRLRNKSVSRVFPRQLAAPRRAWQDIRDML